MELPSSRKAAQVEDFLVNNHEVLIKGGFVKRNAVHILTQKRLSLILGSSKMDTATAKRLVELEPKILASVFLVKRSNLTHLQKERCLATLLRGMNTLSDHAKFSEHQLSRFLLDSNVIPLVGFLQPSHSILGIGWEWRLNT